jgi:glycosyltransferase involved in cell wall biosynthesis
MALLASFIQILFPNKKKTAKYAGNWDPNSQQPWSYRLQKWILSNTFLTRNMQVLVYGEWGNQTKNIKPFFTATYSEKDVKETEFNIKDQAVLPNPKSQLPTSFIYVGTLSKGKQPLYAIQIIEQLHKKGMNITLDLYGEGILRNEIEDYLTANNLKSVVTLKGNQSKKKVLEGYQTSHFLILPSKSEGWPKVVAEAMFWGCVPLVTPVSCVSYMLGNGNRGIILKENLLFDLEQLENVLQNPLAYKEMAEEGKTWSRQFTTDKFEREIKKLLDNQF